MRKSAVFLDRDGPLVIDTGYLRDAATVRIVPGAATALRRLKARGASLVVISNQSGVARGIVSQTDAATVHARFVELFEREGVTFDGCFYCFHGPDAGCDCRKPAPGNLLRAAHELGLELATSVMVGDKASDVEAANRAGCYGLRFDVANSESGEAWARILTEIDEIPGVLAATGE